MTSPSIVSIAIAVLSYDCPDITVLFTDFRIEVTHDDFGVFVDLYNYLVII